jgi:hypothetical protein
MEACSVLAYRHHYQLQQLPQRHNRDRENGDALAHGRRVRDVPHTDRLETSEVQPRRYHWQLRHLP